MVNLCRQLAKVRDDSEAAGYDAAQGQSKSPRGACRPAWALTKQEGSITSRPVVLYAEAAEGLLVQLEGGAEAFEALHPLGEQIGRGSFGKVYVCKVAGNCCKAGLGCVKVVSLCGGPVPRVVAGRGAAQVELLTFFNSVDHPNIVRYHRFVQTQEQLYILMDRCQGPDLQEYLEAYSESLLPLDGVRSIVRQVLLAVAAVHSWGIMHRDIKPANFRFRDQHSGMLQLLDFEMAKPCAARPSLHTVIGTMLYVAPEVFGGVYMRNCDLWSAGCVLFQLVSGQLPFDCSDRDVLHSMHHDPVLMGPCLLRGRRWAQVLPAHGLVRGLLELDPPKRLSAAAAARHEWLTGREEACCAEAAQGADMLEASTLPSMLRRSGPVWDISKCCHSDTEDSASEGEDVKTAMPLMSLTRSHSIWDLVDHAESLCSADDVDSRGVDVGSPL